MNTRRHLYDGAIRLAVPFIEAALASGNAVPAASIAEQAVRLALAIQDHVDTIKDREFATPIGTAGPEAESIVVTAMTDDSLVVPPWRQGAPEQGGKKPPATA
jgi:hypothetical protein